MPIDPVHEAGITLIGPGLVGCWLGILGGLDRVIPGRSGRLRGVAALAPDGCELHWRPGLTQTSAGPALICTRIPDTPQTRPAGSLAVQNGLSQACPVGVLLGAIDQDHQGRLHATGPAPRLVLPPLAPAWTPLLSAWRRRGVEVQAVADTAPARWEKCILNATVGPLCLATGCTMAQVWRRERALVFAATAEGADIARASGIALPPGLTDRAARFFDAVGAHRPSVLDDPRELDGVLGPLLAAAAQTGLPSVALGTIRERCAAALKA